MDKIVGVIGSVPAIKSRHDDEFSDRLGYKYSVGMFVLFAVIVSTKQYVGEPIQCWVPAHFTGSHERYTNHYCWIGNSYYLGLEERVPKPEQHHEKRIIKYYQWVPMLLVLQALMCYAPIILWRMFNSKAGIDINSVIQCGESFIRSENAGRRKEIIAYMTHHMTRYLDVRNAPRSRCSLSDAIRDNLSRLYVVFKIVFIACIFLQIFVLNYFLGHNFHTYGADVLRETLYGDVDLTFDRFPRIAMCDLDVRRLGNNQRYTVQCVLPVNLFNEKIYLVIWFWLIILIVIMSLSLINLVYFMILRRNKRNFVKRYSTFIGGLKASTTNAALTSFVDDYLKSDGVFILRLISRNTNALTTSDFIDALYDDYLRRKKNYVDDDEEEDLKKDVERV